MKLRVAVAFGGVSVEHEISILSAMQVMAALDEDAYDILPLYIAKDGRMYHHASLRDVESFYDLTALCEKTPEVHMLRKGTQVVLMQDKHSWFKQDQPIDFVLPILHGTNGEDGCFQGFLKTLQVPFAECGVLAGALGQDKAIMKMVLQDRGLPITPWFYRWKHEPLDEQFFQKAERLGYPMIVKPSNLGSSIGIVKVHDAKQLKQAMIEGFAYDEKIVIEKLITPLREINASVMGNAKNQHCSVLEEVMKQDEILSFHDKYETASSSKGMASAARKIPAPLTDDEKAEITTYAKECFRVLQGEGVVRIDFLMQEDTGDIYVNEINSIPGSLAFYLWEKSGVPFSQLLEEIIQLGIERWRMEQKRTVTFATNVLSLQGKQGIKK